MVPLWIDCVLKYYSLFGFYSSSCSKLSEKIFRSITSAVQLGCCIFCSVWVFVAFADEKTIMSFLDAINFFLYYLTCALTYWLILYDSYTNENIEIAFWSNFNRIGEQFYVPMKSTKWDFLCAFFWIILADLVCLSYSLYRENTTNIKDKFMHFTLIVVIDHRMFFYLLHLKVLAEQLRQIEAELQNHPSKVQCNLIATFYELVYEMSDIVNVAFGWSNLAIMLLSLHTSVTFSNFVYRQANQKFHNFDKSQWNSFIHLNELI